MKTDHGSCHCRVVTYEVDADFIEGMHCNCSHCKRKGMLLAFVPKTQFRLLSGENNLAAYHFNKKTIDHLFCTTCGVQSYGQSGDTIAINLNCIDDEDLDINSLTTKNVDGKSF